MSNKAETERRTLGVRVFLESGVGQVYTQITAESGSWIVTEVVLITGERSTGEISQET